jgi:hypothetical protein
MNTMRFLPGAESRSEGVHFKVHVHTADLDFAFLLAGLCKIVRKLHP